MTACFQARLFVHVCGMCQSHSHTHKQKAFWILCPITTLLLPCMYFMLQDTIGVTGVCRSVQRRRLSEINETCHILLSMTKDLKNRRQGVGFSVWLMTVVKEQKDESRKHLERVRLPSVRAPVFGNDRMVWKRVLHGV